MTLLESKDAVIDELEREKDALVEEKERLSRTLSQTGANLTRSQAQVSDLLEVGEELRDELRGLEEEDGGPCGRRTTDNASVKETKQHKPKPLRYDGGTLFIIRNEAK